MWQCLLGHPIRSMGSVWHLGTFNGIMRRICSNSALLSLPFTPVLEEILNVISSDLMKTRCLNSNKGAAKVEEARREKKSSCWYLSAKQSIEFCAVKLELTYCAPNNAFKPDDRDRTCGEGKGIPCLLDPCPSRFRKAARVGVAEWVGGVLKPHHVRLPSHWPNFMQAHGLCSQAGRATNQRDQQQQTAFKERER
ncbi:uncharacterized protein LOC144589338 isoform X1 [Pogona vitticeps]